LIENRALIELVQKRVPKILAYRQCYWARRRIQWLEQLPPFERAPFLTPEGFVHSVCTEEEFQRRWRRFSCGMFEGLDWSNVFIAGGAMLGMLLLPSWRADSQAGAEVLTGLSASESTTRSVCHRDWRRELQGLGH